jgi:tRNA-binding protein
MMRSLERFSPAAIERLSLLGDHVPMFGAGVRGYHRGLTSNKELCMSSPSGQPAASNAPAPAPAVAPPEPGVKPEIAFDEFAKVDLRVARVIAAENHPQADKLLKLQLDDGSGKPRQICAGIRGYYAPEELVGKLIVIVANLAPRKIRGEESRGMLLAASDAPKDPASSPESRRVVVIQPMGDIGPGSIVT